MATAVFTGISSHVLNCVANALSLQKTESKDPQGAQIVTVKYADTAEEK